MACSLSSPAIGSVGFDFRAFLLFVGSNFQNVRPRMRRPSVIQRAKEIAIETKAAAREVIGEREQATQAAPTLPDAPLPEKLEQTLQFLAEHPELVDNWESGADTQLAAYLGLNRPASARFWRLKAMELWPAYLVSKSHQHTAPNASEKDGTDDGDDAGVSEDATSEYTASSRTWKTSAKPGKCATPDDGMERRENASKISTRATTRDGSTPALSVTVKEAATMLGLSESYVRELRNNKKLRSSGRNKKLILVSSVKAYQEARQKMEKNESYESQENAHQNEHGNGRSEAAIHLEEYAQLPA